MVTKLDIQIIHIQDGSYSLNPSLIPFEGVISKIFKRSIET